MEIFSNVLCVWVVLALPRETSAQYDPEEIKGLDGQVTNILDLYKNPAYRELALTWIGNYFTVTDDLFWKDDYGPHSRLLQIQNVSDLLAIFPNNANFEYFTQQFQLAAPAGTSDDLLDLSKEEQIHFNPTVLGSVRQDDNPFSELIKFNSYLESISKTRRQTVRAKHNRVNRGRMKQLLDNVFNFPRNHQTDPDLKDLIKIFIAKKFRDAKLLTFVQQFIPLQFEDLFHQKAPFGNNVIGILPGRMWGTYEDKITLLGAHWDTVDSSPGYNDNGSGLVAMLEVIRILVENHCVPQYSLVFVAFDLEEFGSQGSLHFVKDYLTTHVFQSFDRPYFQGAFILDTILNHDFSEGSQTFPEDWCDELPDIVSQVNQSGNRGDFQALIYRKGTEDFLAESLQRHWSRLKNDEMPLLLMGVNMPPKYSDANDLGGKINFLRSDHARFWYMKTEKGSFSLRSVLLTDTGPYRGWMKDCYHEECDNKDSIKPNTTQSLTFLAKTTQALANTLIELNNLKCYGADRKGRRMKFSWAKHSGGADFKQIVNTWKNLKLF